MFRPISSLLWYFFPPLISPNLSLFHPPPCFCLSVFLCCRKFISFSLLFLKALEHLSHPQWEFYYVLRVNVRVHVCVLVCASVGVSARVGACVWESVGSRRKWWSRRERDSIFLGPLPSSVKRLRHKSWLFKAEFAAIFLKSGNLFWVYKLIKSYVNVNKYPSIPRILKTRELSQMKRPSSNIFNFIWPVSRNGIFQLALKYIFLNKGGQNYLA